MMDPVPGHNLARGPRHPIQIGRKPPTLISAGLKNRAVRRIMRGTQTCGATYRFPSPAAKFDLGARNRTFSRPRRSTCDPAGCGHEEGSKECRRIAALAQAAGVEVAYPLLVVFVVLAPTTICVLHFRTAGTGIPTWCGYPLRDELFAAPLLGCTPETTRSGGHAHR